MFTRHHALHVTYHVSCLTCQVSGVRYQVFFFFFFFGPSGGARLWRVCYQRNLPRLLLSKGRKDKSQWKCRCIVKTVDLIVVLLLRQISFKFYRWLAIYSRNFCRPGQSKVVPKTVLSYIYSPVVLRRQQAKR